VTHEYPPHDFYDSVTRARVNALSHFGFTERQREFLVNRNGPLRLFLGAAVMRLHRHRVAVTNDASSRSASTDTRTGPTESAAHAARSVIQTGIAAVGCSCSQSQTSRPCRTLRCTRMVWPCSGCHG
jgi:hypothetical protein